MIATLKTEDRFIILRGGGIVSNDHNNVESWWDYKNEIEAEKAFDQIMDYAKATFQGLTDGREILSDKDRVILNLEGFSWDVPRGTTVGFIMDFLEKVRKSGNRLWPEVFSKDKFTMILGEDGEFHCHKRDSGDSYDTFMEEDHPKENPDSRNRWAKQLGLDATYDAAKLLDIIRPEVETILLTAGFVTPGSQSMRVMDCLRVLEERLAIIRSKRDNEVMDPAFNMKQGFVLSKVINTLKAFQAVHKTITILEGTVI